MYHSKNCTLPLSYYTFILYSSVDFDREGLANAQVKSADIIHGKRAPRQMARSGSKDCVIS